MPELAELSSPFFVIAATFVLVGIARTHSAAHGSTNTAGVWQWLTGVAELKYLFGLASKASSFVASYFAASQLRQMAKWLTALGTLTSGWFAISALFAETVVAALERVYHAAEHALSRANSVTHAFHAFRSLVRTEIAHLTHAVTVTLPREIGRVRHEVAHLTHAIDVTIPRELGRIHAGERALEHDIESLRKRTKLLERGAIKTFDWIRTHPFGAAMTAFVGALAVALERVGLGFLRCPNRSDVGGLRGCGLWDALAKLVPLGVLLTIAFDFPAFVSAARAVAEGIGSSVAAIEGAFDPQLPALPPPNTQ